MWGALTMTVSHRPTLRSESHLGSPPLRTAGLHTAPAPAKSPAQSGGAAVERHGARGVQQWVDRLQREGLPWVGVVAHRRTRKTWSWPKTSTDSRMLRSKSARMALASAGDTSMLLHHTAERAR